MPEPVLLAGVGMTPFARHPGRGVRDMARSAAFEALDNASVPATDVSKIYFGNAADGVISHQEMIRGQVAFRRSELSGVPLVNVENACASGGSALNLAWESVAGGRSDVALVVGVEQLTHAEKFRTFAALRGSTDIDEIGEAPYGEVAPNSVLMDFYAEEARDYLAETDATPADLAQVAVKNRQNAAHNPLALYRGPQTVEEVLAGRTIVSPLTLAMCSPVTDGAAALVLCSREYGARLNGRTLEILASELRAGRERGSSPVADAAAAAFAAASVGPDDLDVLELHDAAAPAELIQYGEVGLCGPGEGHHMLRRGETELGGRIPVNTSGGLMSRGHPLGATGCAQIVELHDQLLERADGRQVDGARLGMAVNAGGWLGGAYATVVATIVARTS
ncbi:MAG TPA: thiolase family protein [Solirubrobacteraceae bacterium]|nr:thiolase family protein [Solirubrobacteraceae bacterium]